MIKSKVQKFVDGCVEAGIAQGLWSEKLRGKYSVEIPKHKGQGDFSTNFAMVAAGIEKRNPRELATQFIECAGSEGDLVERLEIAGPGFVNVFKPFCLGNSHRANMYSGHIVWSASCE